MSITGGGDVESVSSSVPSSIAGSAPATPRNRVKFMCSRGGKILPRPADGRLKYVGGETRVVCVPRDITFHELMKKLTSMFSGEMILKYMLIPEDIDVLVTVKSDEDVHHMIEECDRHDLLSSRRLRAFLFSSKPIVIENMVDHNPLRYINSVNGIIIHPSPTYTTFKPPPIYTSYTTFTISSACSSPRTPPETTTTATCSTTNPEVTLNHGSSSFCNQQNPVNHQQLHHFHHHQPPKPPLDPHLHKASGSENR
ncbi:hypothetical protein LXL04_038805 [Taraxacum kok-saghyz]